MNTLPTRIITFYGDQLVAVQGEHGTIYAVLSRLCENLGLNTQGQARRLRQHPVMQKALITATIQTEGGPQTAQLFAAEMIPFFLGTLHAGKVKPELREKLNLYQEQVVRVLWAAFRAQIVSDTAEDDPSILALQQIAENALAVAQLAQQQIEFQRATNTRLDKAAHVVRDLQVRLGVLEDTTATLSDKLQPAAYITDEQATEVSTQVKALAELLTVKDASKNHYQGIFAELYRRFGVSSYKNIRQGQYQAVLNFLEDWRKAETRTTPFA